MPKLIVGLGNPGAQYANTRHNVGWMALDAFARKHGVALDRQRFHGLQGELLWHGEKVILLKPLTYMNLSGQAVAPTVRFFKIALPDLLVVYDDLDLKPGTLRMREKGSAGGHNGMKSIIQELGTEEFPRLRIGIGRPAPGWSVVDWVLSPFGPEDQAIIAETLPRAVEAIESFLTDGPAKTMSKFNG
ncbi:MAG TPA: aminoacyl-tRNA hydrolase [Symbiobacteriaceae bacterium]